MLVDAYIKAGNVLEIMQFHYHPIESTERNKKLKASDQKQIMRNLRASRRHCARLINQNFAGDGIWVGLDYSDENLPADDEAAMRAGEIFEKAAGQKKTPGHDAAKIYRQHRKLGDAGASSCDSQQDRIRGAEKALDARESILCRDGRLFGLHQHCQLHHERKERKAQEKVDSVQKPDSAGDYHRRRQKSWRCKNSARVQRTGPGYRSRRFRSRTVCALYEN